MTVEAGTSGRSSAPRSALAGATVMQVLPSLEDDSVGRTAFNGALALLRVGARAIVASNGGSLVGELQASGGEWMQLSPPRRPTGSRLTRHLREMIASERIDLVHAHGFDVAADVIGATEGTSTRLLTTYIHAPVHRHFFPSLRRKPKAYGDAIVVGSAFAADFVAKQYAIEPARIVILPRTVDTTWFDARAVSADRLAAVRDAWQVGRRRTVFAPGRIAEGKGQMALIEAARALVNGGLRDVAFVIAGSRHSDENRARTIDDAIIAHGLRSVVRRVGPCADMPAAYAAAAFVCIPGHRPTLFSQIAAEAQATGRPVIASDVGALREAVLTARRVGADGRTGWLAPPGDPLDLARALADALATGPEAWHALCARARQFAEWKHAPARVAELTLETYAAMLGPD
jgi:glycosyltransferase involved in cell wall biosynthesis